MFEVSDIIYPKCKEEKEKEAKGGSNGCNESGISPGELKMMKRIAASGAVVKSQQVGEDEMLVPEKVEHLTELYCRSKLSFLRRFGDHMNIDDLDYFSLASVPENYEMEFYVKKYRAFLDPSRREVVVKNRRYNYLQRVLKQSDYFSDAEIEKRNPLLFQQYIGQYCSDEASKTNQPENFSQYLLTSIDRSLVNFQCQLEEQAQDDQEEEEEEEDTEEEDTEEEEEEEEEEATKKVRKKKTKKKTVPKEAPLKPDERLRLREEFLALMEEYFIEGRDNFDYDLVDRDDQYDDMEDQDIEDRYFDDEDAD